MIGEKEKKSGQRSQLVFNIFFPNIISQMFQFCISSV